MNNDNLCGVRAFFIGKAIADEHKRIDNLSRPNNKEIEKQTQEVVTALDLSNSPCGLPEIRALEEYFEVYRVTIYDHNVKHTKKPIYIGEQKEKFIYLLLLNFHFYVIRTPCSFFKKNKFCHYCKLAFNNLKTHYCKFICSCCKRSNCKRLGSFKCQNCNKNCANDDCLSIYANKFCIPNKTCEDCGKLYAFKHVCDDNKKWCKNCNKSVFFDLKCFIMKETIKENAKLKGFIFFDFEAS